MSNIIALHVAARGEPVTRLFLDDQAVAKSIHRWLLDTGFTVLIVAKPQHSARTPGEEVVAAMILRRYHEELEYVQATLH